MAHSGVVGLQKHFFRLIKFQTFFQNVHVSTRTRGRQSRIKESNPHAKQVVLDLQNSLESTLDLSKVHFHIQLLHLHEFTYFPEKNAHSIHLFV